MKELLQNLETISIEEANRYTLIDTCELVYIFEHPEKIKKFEKIIKEGNYAITSFNIEELMHIEHRLKPKTKEAIRKFLKEKEELKIINVDVHPGNRDSEIKYMQSISGELVKIMKDPSDGVMFATALKIKGNIVTRDKHDIYNQICERFANEHKVEIRNKI